MVTPNGKAFVINSTVDQATTTPIVMILHWKPEQ